MRRYFAITFFLFFSFLLVGQEQLDTQLYKLAKDAPKTKEIEQLVRFFETAVDKKEDLALLVSYWMMQNIEYDVEGYSNGNYQSDWEHTLQSGKAVCSGYANLFKAFCDRVRLNCSVISGFAKGYGYSIGEKFDGPNHAWNLIEINNQYYLFDITWASCYVSTVLDSLKYFKFPEPTYLFSDPKTFIEKHLPCQKRWQLLMSPVSFQRFSNFESFSQMTDVSTTRYNYQDSIRNYLAKDLVDQWIMDAEESYLVFPSQLDLARSYERIAYELSSSTSEKARLKRAKYYYSSALALFTDTADIRRCEIGIKFVQFYLNRM